VGLRVLVSTVTLLEIVKLRILGDGVGIAEQRLV
jgi:hypothetical protein